MAESFYTKFLQRPDREAAETPEFRRIARDRLPAPILHRLRRAAGLRGGAVTTRIELVLDRFIPPAGGGMAIDLATGGPVLLRTLAPGGEPDYGRRAQTAARVWALRIPGMATLVDFGADGRRGWVEAYRLAGCRPRAGTVPALLAAAGCIVSGPERDSGREAAADASFIPEPLDRVILAESEATASPAAGLGRAPAIGALICRRDELEAILESITAPSESGARLVRIDAPRGAGVRTLYAAIAREARTAGFVPVSSVFCADRAIYPSWLDAASLCAALRDRHVVLLDAAGPGVPAQDGAGIARFLSRLDTAGGRTHAVVCARLPVVGAARVVLGPLRPGLLRRSVLCAGVDPRRAAQGIDEAIRRSGGWPGPFAVSLRELLGVGADEPPYRFPAPGAGSSSVREAAPDRREAGAVPDTANGQAPAVLLRAAGLVERGRHAAAERLLRRSVGRLHRRHRLADEARAQLALGSLLMNRGRVAGARAAFEESRRLADDACDAAGVVRALLHLGAANIQDGVLPAAESVLRTAETGAARASLAELRRAAELLLARCLFWQGRHEDAWRLVEGSGGESAARFDMAAAVAERADAGSSGTAWGATAEAGWHLPGLSIAAAEIGVRLALSRHDAGLAARRLAAAAGGRDGDEPMHAGLLIALRLLVRGALGEVGEVGRVAVSGLELMRRLHAPLVAQEVRLGQLEAYIEAGARHQASACLRRLSSRPPAALPGLARMRLEALTARLGNLERDGAGLGLADDTAIDTGAVLRILEHCHEAQSESDAVAGVCQTVRTALRAGAVSVFGLVEGALQLVASAGPRACRPEVAERSAHALLVVGPEESTAGRELAAPVRYGGAAIGALAVRWAPGAPGGEARARGIASAAAAAIGPALAALISARPPKPDGEAGAGDLGGPSAAMTELRRQVGRAAAAPYPVLILGESGTGKELIARAIHAGSGRRSRRLCAVNCAALGDDLFESELFGHARGSFTGAASDRPGLFEEADGGTLFLDEVGELSPRAQAKLLRAIQEGEIRRVGENHPRRVDARIVAATNRPLGDEVRDGRFRHDLLYRLDVVRIVVPPLRERPEDVGPLARQFWRDAMRRTGGQAELSPATLAALARYPWPGNVRELQNTLAALAVDAPPRGRVGPSRLPAAMGGAGGEAQGDAPTLAEARRRFEEQFVRATLARAGGQRANAASALGLSRQGLAKVMTRLGIAGEERAARY
jgi:two-component system NtrC family response regulator